MYTGHLPLTVNAQNSMYTHEVHTASWLMYKAVDRSALITTTRIQVHMAHMLTGMWEYMHWMTSCLHLHMNPKTHISGTVHVVTSSTLLLNWGNYLYVQCTSNILSCQCEFFEPVSKDKLTTIGVLPNNAIIAMYVWIHNNWDVLYNAESREIDGKGEGGEKRMEMEMDVIPHQDTCICECRCNYSVHVLSRITDHHYYEVLSHVYLHVQCIPHMYVYTKHYRRWAQKSVQLLPTTDKGVQSPLEYELLYQQLASFKFKTFSWHWFFGYELNTWYSHDWQKGGIYTNELCK